MDQRSGYGLESRLEDPLLLLLPRLDLPEKLRALHECLYFIEFIKLIAKKGYNAQTKLSIISLFGNKFNKFNNT